jgi:hypothetical protein
MRSKAEVINHSRLGEFDTPLGGKSQKLILIVSNSILGCK